MCHILSCSLRRRNSVSPISVSVWSIFIFITYEINPYMPYELCQSFEKPPSYTLLCIPSVKLIIIAPSVLLEHPCCPQRLFFLAWAAVDAVHAPRAARPSLCGCLLSRSANAEACEGQTRRLWLIYTQLCARTSSRHNGLLYSMM